MAFSCQQDLTMCGRFTQHYTWAEVHAFLNVFGDLGTPRNLQPRYNIAPTEFIDVVTTRVRDREIVGREMVPMRWGRSPPGGRNPGKTCRRLSTPALRRSPRSRCSARLQIRRCIIPASGFYEWTGGKGAEAAHLLRRPTAPRCWHSRGSGTARSIPTTLTRLSPPRSSSRVRAPA